jgi:hypothetical protein
MTARTNLAWWSFAMSPAGNRIRIGSLSTSSRQQKTLVDLGALQSLTFKAVGPAGPDIYLSKFEKGSLEWRIWHNLDGGIDFFNYRPVPPTK